MKKHTFHKPRGFQDILPKQSKKMQDIYNLFIDICNSFNCWEIKLPLLEDTNLFKRSLGMETDVVSKEMYSFEDLSLRPEVTAQTVRFSMENQQIGRFCYYGECFRYERPQYNRYRQFYTLGIEFLGSNSVLCDDLELLCLLDTFFRKLNIKYKIYVNSIGTSRDRALYLEHIENIFKQQQNNLSKSSVNKLVNGNIWRILDSKEDQDNNVIKELPSILDYINKDDQDHFDKVCDFLKQKQYNWEIKSNLIRGLDYYNGLVFECVAYSDSDNYKKNLSICGGGRYDGLFCQLEGEKTKAVGLGIGLDRILDLAHIAPAHKKKILFNFIDSSYEFFINRFRTMYTVDCISTSMKKLFHKHSDKYDFFVILAQEWIDQKKMIIKDLKSGQQMIYSLQDTLNYFHIH